MANENHFATHGPDCDCFRHRSIEAPQLKKGHSCNLVARRKPVGSQAVRRKDDRDHVGLLAKRIEKRLNK